MSAERDGLGPVGLATLLLQRRRAIARTAAIAALLVATVLLVRPRQYASSASFTPQARRQPSALSGLAAQFGLAVPQQDGSQSPAFYVDLLLSREILGDVAMGRYALRTAGGTRDTLLADVLGAEGRTDEEKRERAIRLLKDRLGASANYKTGVVDVTVTLGEPHLATDVLKRLLDQLDAFNQRRRKSQATTERQFTERRLAEVKQELRDAEDRQQAFLQRNRDYRNSPELAFQHDRLAREVAMRQQLYTTLAQAFEQARIDEVRDTPVLSLVEEPEVPAFPNGRGLIRYTLVAIVLGALAAAVLLVLLELARPEPSVSEATEALREAWRATRTELRRPWRLLRG